MKLTDTDVVNLTEWLHALEEGALEEGQRAQLEAMLAQNEEARRFYVERMSLGAALCKMADEAQGAELKDRIDAGELPFLRGLGRPGPGGGFGHFGHFGRFGHVEKLETAASYLGLSEAELRERLADGKTLAEIAKAEGKSVDGLVQALVKDAKARLDQAVAAGKLTRAEADEIAERLGERITDLVNGELPKPGFGFRHRFDGHEHPFERRARSV